MSEPLAERMRPRSLDDYVGQKHLVGPNAVLRNMIEGGRIPSFILWGPPGVGKTTLAQIVAKKLETPFYTLSAVTSGVKDVREVIEKAKSGRFFGSHSPILFIDEIHRFSQSRLAAGSSRKRHRYTYRSHHRKPIVRGYSPFALALSAICAAKP